MRLYLLEAPATWILEHLPEWSLREGPYGLAVWQWILIPAAAALSLFAGALASWVIVRVLKPFAKRSATLWDERAVDKSKGPLVLFTALGVARALVPSLGLVDTARETVINTLVAAALFGIFWSLWRIVDMIASGLATAPSVIDNPGARSLLSIASTTAKILVFVFGSITALGHLGVQVASLVAGLGIGGLAFALAAQKTIENLFGSITLGVDRPLAIGDTVKIDDFTALVEHIGLRSTRFRTADETVITIPNGRLADMRIENISQRTRIRFAAKLALAYDTDVTVIRAILGDLRLHLEGMTKIESETVSVALVALAESSFTVDVIAWFQSTSLDEYQAFREEALLGLIGIVEQHGASVAFPTRTVRLARAHAAKTAAP